MIDYQQSFRMYQKWLAWPHCKEVDFELSNWYQNKCIFYLDEVKPKKENCTLLFLKAGVFYVFIIPCVLLFWVIIVLFFKIYHRIVK